MRSKSSKPHKKGDEAVCDGSTYVPDTSSFISSAAQESENYPNLNVTLSDSFSAMLVGGVSGIPAIGGIIAKALEISAPNRVDRIARWCDILMQKVQENAVQLDFVSDELEKLLRKSVLRAADSSSEKRIDFLTGLVFNAAFSQGSIKSSYDFLDDILSQIDDQQVLMICRYYPKLGLKRFSISSFYSEVVGRRNRNLVRKQKLDHLINLRLLKKGSRHVSIDSLGMLLVEQIGLNEPDLSLQTTSRSPSSSTTADKKAPPDSE